MTGASIKFLAALVLVLTSKHAAGALVQKASTITSDNPGPLGPLYSSCGDVYLCDAEEAEEAKDIHTYIETVILLRPLETRITDTEQNITWCVITEHAALEDKRRRQLMTLIEKVANLTAQSPKAMYRILKEDIISKETEYKKTTQWDYRAIAKAALITLNEKLANFTVMYADTVFRILLENNATGASGTQDELTDFEAKYPKGALQVYKEDIIKKDAEDKCASGDFHGKLDIWTEKTKLIHSLRILETSHPAIALESLVEDIVNKDAEIAVALAKPDCAGATAAKDGKETLKGLLADLTYREKAATTLAISKSRGGRRQILQQAAGNGRVGSVKGR